jgi:hypothetical protein
MRVLLDNCTPRGVVACLGRHIVKECRSFGWDELTNGELLDTAESAGFEVFVTADKGIRYQQNLSGRKIAIVLLGTARWSAIRRMLPQVGAAVDDASRGSFLELDIPDR